MFGRSESKAGEHKIRPYEIGCKTKAGAASSAPTEPEIKTRRTDFFHIVYSKPSTTFEAVLHRQHLFRGET